MIQWAASDPVQNTMGPSLRKQTKRKWKLKIQYNTKMDFSKILPEKYVIFINKKV